MGIFDDAAAIVLLADYIGIDSGGKINALGEGFLVSGGQGNGLTSPQYVAALIDVPAKYVGQEFAVCLELRDLTTDAVAQAPGPSGRLEAIRVQQMAKVPRTEVPGVYLDPDMFSRVQVVMGFPTGLPLPLGHYYAWRLEVDGHHRKGWQAKFYVPGPPPGMVFGGPAGPGPAGLPMLPPDLGPQGID